MIKKILIILLIGINCHNFGMQLKQPKALSCQALKAIVKNALKEGKVAEFNKLPNELMIPASYLYQAKNNPTVALFNNYVDLHKNANLDNLTNLFKLCGADIDLINNVIDELNAYSWNFQKAFNKGLVKKNNLKGIELFVLSKLKKEIDINSIDQSGPVKKAALFNAIDAGDINLVRLLINSGANVNLEGSHEGTLGYILTLTPLQEAVFEAVVHRLSDQTETDILNRYKEIILLLLSSEARINTVINGTSALGAAGNDQQLVNFLKSKGAKLSKEELLAEESTK